MKPFLMASIAALALSGAAGCAQMRGDRASADAVGTEGGGVAASSGATSSEDQLEDRTTPSEASRTYIGAPPESTAESRPAQSSSDQSDRVGASQSGPTAGRTPGATGGSTSSENGTSSSSSADATTDSSALAQYQVAPNTYATAPVVSPGDPVGGGAPAGEASEASGGGASGSQSGASSGHDMSTASGSSAPSSDSSSSGGASSTQGGGTAGSTTRVESNASRLDRPAYQCNGEQECRALQTALSGDALGGIVRRGGVAIASPNSIAAKDLKGASVVDPQGREIGKADSVAIGRDGRLETVLVGGSPAASYKFSDLAVQRESDGAPRLVARGGPTGAAAPASVRLETLLGTELQFQGSTDRARIDDIVYDLGGRPSGVVLLKGDVAGIGGKRAAVPYASVQTGGAGTSPSLNMTVSQFDRLESFYYSVASR